MPEWMIKNAALAAFVAAGVTPAFAMEWRPELQAQGRYSQQEYNAGSALSPQRFSSAGSAFSDVDVLFSPTLIVDQNLQGFFGAAAGWQRAGGQESHELRLLEAGASLSNDQQTERLTLGKVKVRWSQDSVYHPLDLFGRYNQPKSTLGVNEFDDFKKEGNVMARWQRTGDVLSHDVLLVDADNNASMPTAYQVAWRGVIQSGESEFSLIAEKSANYHPRWGAGLSQGMGEQWTLYGEYLLSRDRDIPVLRQVQPEIPLSPGVALPALYDYQRDDKQRNWQKLLLTLRYYLQVGGSVEGSLFYNGHGLNRREWSQWESRQWSAAETLTAPQLRPYLAEGNPYIPMLGESARLMQDFYLRRFYASVRLDSLERFTQGRIEINMIFGLEDGSSSLWMAGEYPLNEKLLVKPYLMLQSNMRGEGQMAPLSALFGLNFTLALL